MSMVSFGDLAQSFMLRAHSTRMKGKIGNLVEEMASARVHDLGANLRGDHNRLSALSHARALTSGYQSAADEAAYRTSSLQSLIASINENAENLAPSLLVTPIAGKVELLADEAAARLTSVLSAMNISLGGRSLLGGQQVNGPAIASADTILTALKSEITGLERVEDVIARIDSWFGDPAGFTATAYLGGPQETALAVSPDDRVWLGPTAADPAFAAAIKGFAMAALINGTLPDDDSSRALAQKAGEALLTGQSALIDLAAKIGVSEARIDGARSRNAAELITLEMAQSELVTNDPLRSATELEALQTNLETLYTITARLSRLSLTDLLR